MRFTAPSEAGATILAGTAPRLLKPTVPPVFRTRKPTVTLLRGPNHSSSLRPAMACMRSSSMPVVSWAGNRAGRLARARKATSGNERWFMEKRGIGTGWRFGKAKSTEVPSSLLNRLLRLVLQDTDLPGKFLEVLFLLLELGLLLLLRLHFLE